MEFVYVVDRRDLFDLAFPHGFVGRRAVEGHPSLEGYLERATSHGYFVERAHAEQRSDKKQIIPYTLVLKDSRIFVVRRKSGGGEARLFGKRSVGIGGHINPVDDEEGRERIIFSAARRELEEELAITGGYNLSLAGVINDDTNPVGSVHFGVVLLARLVGGDAKVREQDTLEGAFMPASDAVALAQRPEANFETWSSLIMESLTDTLLENTPEASDA